MKRVLLSALLILAALSLFPLNAEADRFSVYDDDVINVTFGFREWFSSANAKWQISFPYRTLTANPGISKDTQGKIESELDFNKIDSNLHTLNVGWRIAPRFSMDVLYGWGTIEKGLGTDTDRFKANGGGGLEFSQSTSDVTGDVRMWGGNVYFNNRRFGDTKAGPWGAVLGFLHYEDNLTMKNAVQNVSVPFDGQQFPAVGPFPGLDSTFDLTWNALKVGVTNQAAITKEFKFDGMLSLYPYVRYYGEGYWNLRTGNDPTDFRRQFPNFTQQSTTGYGYEATLGLTYDLSENAALSAGYRYFYLYANNGTDTVYFANGATSESNLDWVTVTRHGAYAEILFKF